MISPKRSLTRWSLAFVTMGSIAAAAAAQDGVCQGYERSQRVSRFGSNPISNDRADTLEDLQRMMQEYRAEMTSILESKGLGHLVDELYAAIAGGSVNERDLASGETFEWMASRRTGEAAAGDPICLTISSSYEAWEIRVVEESVEEPQARCSLRATGDCQAATLAVNAGGSTSDVSVSMSSGGDSTSIISGGATTWSGDFVDRYTTDYSFLAEADATGTRTVTTHTFVVPKVCLNLSYKGEPTVVKETLTASCKETAEVDRCDAPSPACTIALDPASGRTGGDIQVALSGHWDGANADGIVVPVTGPDGGQVAELRSFPTTVSFRDPGLYVFNGTAINEAGETRTCSAELSVDPRFTVRVFPVRIDPDDDSLVRVVAAGGGALAKSAPEAALPGPQGQVVFTPGTELTRFDLDTAYGLGGEIEYHFNRRLGLNASVIIGQVDSQVHFDTDTVWERSGSDLDYLSVTVGPNFHLTPERKVDFYLGPFLGFVDLGASNFSLPSKRERLELGSELVFGALLGLDIPVGARRVWAFHAGSRFVDLDSSGLNVDPFLLELGIARKF